MNPLWVIGLIAGGVVLYFAYEMLTGVFGRDGRLQTKLVLADHTAIAQVKDGQRVKLEGVVSADAPEFLESRVSGEPIVCSHLSLTFKSPGDSRFFELDRHIPFFIEDASGRARVQVEAASVHYGAGKHQTSITGDLEGWARQAIEADGVVFAGAARGTLGVVEQFLRPGDRVAVLGLAQRDGGGDEFLTIVADPELGVIISGHRHAFDDTDPAANMAR